MTWHLELTPKAEKILAKAMKKDRQLAADIAGVFQSMAQDPFEGPGIKTQRYPQLDKATGGKTYETYLSRRGAAWRCWWVEGDQQELKVLVASGEADEGDEHLILILTADSHPPASGKTSL
jgi:hypothetical protein